MPIPSVDQVGVRYFGWIRANWLGSALCAAIERLVRAVGRIVVWVEADADVRIVAANSTWSTTPIQLPPNTSGAITLKTSPALSGLPRPIPLVPTPAKDTVAIVTSR